jgi:DNA-binding MarR family transcriptional regulator
VAEKQRPKRPTEPRAALIRRLTEVGGRVAAATVRFHCAAADSRELSAGDMRMLELLMTRGPLTHSQLCQATGMAKPSVSERIDRLERRRYAHRDRSRAPGDRRRVLVVADSDRVSADLGPVFAWGAVFDHGFYDSFRDQELAIITGFLGTVAQEFEHAAEQLGGIAPASVRVDPVPPPRPARRRPAKRKRTFAQRFLGE